MPAPDQLDTHTNIATIIPAAALAICALIFVMFSPTLAVLCAIFCGVVVLCRLSAQLNELIAATRQPTSESDAT